MKEENKITLPSELQEQMMDFFIKTSIPRRKQAIINLLSEKNQMGEMQNENEDE